MDVFALRDRIIQGYSTFSRSFCKIKAPDIRSKAEVQYAEGRYWPAPLVQLNPSFKDGCALDELVKEGLLHSECLRIFTATASNEAISKPIHLYVHQEKAIRAANRGQHYVLTTGTGSGKSLCYFIPLVNEVLRRKKEDPHHRGITAIVVYPMNALCNSQLEELKKFLDDKNTSITFGRYTGQEDDKDREKLRSNPPDILLTNFVMLEYMLTRQKVVDQTLLSAASNLRFIVLDELHTYRGRQGADVALLLRRLRQRQSLEILCIGTSATMSSEGSQSDRGVVVANFASRLFGVNVLDSNIIQEDLKRVTLFEGIPSNSQLVQAIKSGLSANISFAELQRHPLAVWMESNMGIEEEAKRPGYYHRIQRPLTLKEASDRLSKETLLNTEECGKALNQFLLAIHSVKDPETGRTPFAFRLHQFISGAGNIYSTLEKPGERYLTVEGQQYKPQEREKRLFNLCFCLHCGQEYYPVWSCERNKEIIGFQPRELTERKRNDLSEGAAGFLMPDFERRFDPEDLNNYPDEWIDFGPKVPQLKYHLQAYKPLDYRLNPSGCVSAEGLPVWYVPTPFRLCLNPDCRKDYDGSRRSDLGKLSTLSNEGRSSATTTLTLAVLEYLLSEQCHLPEKAKKLLSFTDNRQDASLQSGHFNDFVHILMTRSALLAALLQRSQGLSHEEIAKATFDVMKLELSDYASATELKGHALKRAEQALQKVLGYRLFMDLEKGWRITNPNLEQLGLLRIEYENLKDCCQDLEHWSKAVEWLEISVEMRCEIATELLDTLRKSLCIKSEYLDPDHQDSIRNNSYQHLTDRWGLSEGENLTPHRLMVPLSKEKTLDSTNKLEFLSSRSRFGRRMLQKIKSVLGPDRFKRENKEESKKETSAELYIRLLIPMLKSLCSYGFLEEVPLEKSKEKIHGYFIVAAALRWVYAGDATQAKDVNQFFRDLYLRVALSYKDSSSILHRVESREHTAQVFADTRVQREKDFREGKLSVLYCSPTMELGVDISTLNVVLLRNVPPTPANYAQRSGRAGRSGQPALIITYCAARSLHDQYFFQEPSRMVSGVVTVPTMDLANEDLVKSHIHAIWLAETGTCLGDSVKDLVDLEQSEKLPIINDLQIGLVKSVARKRAGERASEVMRSVEPELTSVVAPWYQNGWLERTIQGAYEQLERKLDRWREMHRATSQQVAELNDKIRISRDSKVTDQLKARRSEMESHLELLKDVKGDFYTYRYLASEGFIPGYNFPRLPLLAYIPARRKGIGRDTFLARPRFIGLSEFGPHALIYHEGSTYSVVRVNLPISCSSDKPEAASHMPLAQAKLCSACGYSHDREAFKFDHCERCNAPLTGAGLTALLRVERVITRRRQKITSDEEERQRLGYDTVTTWRQPANDQGRRSTPAKVSDEEGVLLEMEYGAATRLWKINLGWRRRTNKSLYGFNIDAKTGSWAKDNQSPEEQDGDVETSSEVRRVTPFVEDNKNTLIINPHGITDPNALVTLQHVLKRSIEVTYQLESSELAVEPLPDAQNRNSFMFYEAAEGGAGILSRIINEPTAIHALARTALSICHYNWDNSLPVVPAKLTDSLLECEAACYRCILSYGNQMDHPAIDRRNSQVLEFLCRLTKASIHKGAHGQHQQQHLEKLESGSQSSLEKTWLHEVQVLGLRLPDREQPLLAQFQTRPDFAYSDVQAVIYVDGPDHHLPIQKAKDEAITKRLQAGGCIVLRFGVDKRTWGSIFEKHTEVFGK